ncbi:MAG: CotH kinase family protein [Planctomycetales bacterium]|nr:CotH kinase family protein [Planctomycetales bacterium]
MKLQYSSRLRFELQANDNRVDSVTRSSRNEYSLRLVRDGANRTWTGYYRTDDADPWELVAELQDGSEDAPNIRDPKVGLFTDAPSLDMTANFQNVRFVVPDEAPVYGSRTNLDLSESMHNVNSSVFLRFPFTIDTNPQLWDQLSFSTRFDDGFRAYLNGTLVAERNAPLPPAPPAPDVVAWNATAVGTHGATAGLIPTERFDLTEFLDQLQVGQNVLAIHGLNIEAADRDFFFDARLNATTFVPNAVQFFTSPTPGEANSVPAAPAPLILGPQGVFFGSTVVELALPQPSAAFQIRYTLDGSEPTAESLLYTAPFQLTQSALVQARVFDTSDSPLEPSPISSGTYLAMEAELQGRDSDIPIMVIDTMTNRFLPDASNDLTTVGVAAFEVSQATGRASLGGVVDYLGRGGVRDRGSSTAGQAKPNMTFETWGAAGTTKDDDANIPLLGLSADSDWVLHAPFSFDRAMIRNQFAYALSNNIGRWAPRTRAVEVYLNRNDTIVGERDYMGVYVLVERIKPDPGRLDIDAITPEDNAEPDISGGYVWKIDRADPDAPGFTAGGLTLNWVHPKSPASRSARDDQKATREQQSWVVDYLGEMATALRDPDISDPEGYSKYADVDSWVDHHLLSVLMDDVDAFALSAYVFKDRDGKVEMGPAWDFDRSMESLDDRDDDPSRWGGSGNSNFFTRGWYTQAFRDPGFWQRYVDRWTEFRRTEFSNQSIDALIDKLAGEIAEAQERNYAATVNRAVRPRSSSSYSSGKLDGTWQGEVEHMRVWLHERLAFMDSTFTGAPRYLLDGEYVPLVNEQTGDALVGITATLGQRIEIRGPIQEVLDDTVLISGDIGTAIGRIFSPSDNALGTDWTQIGFDDASWLEGPMGVGFGGFEELVRTEFNPVEDGTTTMVRIPFQIDNLQSLADNRLTLRMRYDDGFVAYINGQEVARSNLRDDELAWDSRASTRRNSDAEQFEPYDISEFYSALVEGENVLAIRGINSSASSNDMLIAPELVSSAVSIGHNPRARIYYTTDGSDPRGPDGMPAATAQLLPFGEAIVAEKNTRIIARHFDDETYRGDESRIVLTDWSGTLEYNIIVEQPTVTISEINYNPAPVSAAEAAAGFTNQDFEFVELHNFGNADVDLTGVRITGGIEFDFDAAAETRMSPGAGLLVANRAAFEMRYSQGLQDMVVLGEYAGSLDNAGDRIRIVSGTGETLFDMEYNDNDPWSAFADGIGGTLEVQSSVAAGELASKWYQWTTPNHRWQGTPGAFPGNPQPVVINEVVSNPAGPNGADAIELLNLSNAAVDIGGWYLSDNDNDLAKYRIPDNTVLAPGATVVFNQVQFGFGLSGTAGDEVWLTQLDSNGQVTMFMDRIEFGASPEGESIGRFPNGTGRVIRLNTPTLGQANANPISGPVLISEVQYHAVVSDAALAIDPGIGESDLEFIEVYNPTATGVDLSKWQIRGGVDFEFPVDAELPAGRTAIILRFNPDDPENSRRLAAFEAQYGLADGNYLRFGGYGGSLGNSYDLLQLEQSVALDDNNPDLISFLLMDEVLYDDLAPWPTTADGQGASLQRAQGVGSLAASFTAGTPSPGSIGDAVLGDFDGSGEVDVLDLNLLLAALRNPQFDPTYDVTQDGQLDSHDRDVMVESIMGIEYGDSNLDGVFDSQDLVLVFQYEEYEDGVSQNSIWQSGDWNGDGDFTSQDFVVAFQRSSYIANSLRFAEPARLVTSNSLATSAALPGGLPSIRGESVHWQDMAFAAWGNHDDNRAKSNKK